MTSIPRFSLSSPAVRQLSRLALHLLAGAALLVATMILSVGPARSDCGGNSSSNAPTNAGTEFLLCFEQNIDTFTTYDYPGGGGYLEIYIASVSDVPDTVTITSNRYPTLHASFALPVGGYKIYRISDSIIQAGLGVLDTMRDLWITSDGVPDNRVVDVKATSPIVCYGLDFKYQSADAICALPKNNAGTDYRVISYENSTNVFGNPDEQSQFAVAAFTDNTTVTITPAAPTASGNPANVPFTVTLQAGQCVQVQTDPSVPGLDLTGSVVTSDNPVVVYGSHSRTEMPHGWIRPDDGNTSRDMLLESMPPTSDWGKNFVLDAIAISSDGAFNPQGDLVRVLALKSNTSVSVNGHFWTTLGADGFADTMIQGPTMINASGAVLVAEYMHTDYTTNGNGDPFLAIVPPVDQTFNRYTFFLPANPDFALQFVNIVTDSISENAVTLDGQLLPASTFTPVPGAVGNQHFGVLEANIPGTQQLHTISTTMPTTNGLTILGYGLGNVVSYGYTAGSLLVPKRTIAIDPPPQAMGGGEHHNWLTVRDISFESAYLDSATFVPDNPKLNADGVHVKENVAFDIGRLSVGASALIHLTSTFPLESPVAGTVTVYAHTPDYTNLEPATVHFTLFPDATEAVGNTGQGEFPVAASAYPNPFSSSTTINFSLPKSGDIRVTLYDALGREVERIASGEFVEGPYSLRLDRNGLANGVYTCVIYSRSLNLNERVPIVAGE